MKRTLAPRRPSPAMVVALVALCSSLTGVAVGATLITGGDVKNGSIGTKDLKNGGVTKKDLKKNSVRTKKVKNGSLQAEDFAAGEFPGTGPTGLQGPKGDKGDKGDTGAPATRLWAAIDAENPASIAKNSGAATGVERLEPFPVGGGEFLVTWDRDVSDCTYFVTGGGSGTGFPPGVFGSVTSFSTDPNTTYVVLRDAGGALVDEDFAIAVLC
jgi:hypothetical protein